MNRIAISITFACILAGHSHMALGQDRIVLQQPGGSRFPVSGYIEDYTGREILIKLKPNEAARRYPSSDIVEAVTQYTPHHERARSLFVAGQIAEARQQLTTAMDEEDRPWVRREILATQVKCFLWTGDYFGAISRFLPIVRSDSETFHYALVPLNWTDDPPPANLRTEAKELMGFSEPPLSRLIGASWLLKTPDSAEAEQTLRRIARESDVRIQRLAQMQLWRLKLTAGSLIDPDEIERWEQFVENLPVELRGGSHFVIGQAWKARHEYERAARAFLWLPLVFDVDRWLSARACYEAADSLSKADDRTQAAQLYGEVVSRYGDTPWRKNSEAALKATQSDSTEPANSK